MGHKKRVCFADAEPLRQRNNGSKHSLNISVFFIRNNLRDFSPGAEKHRMQTDVFKRLFYKSKPL